MTLKGKHALVTRSSRGIGNLFRKRKLRPLLSSLGIREAGLHAFRHFNVSLLHSLRIPLKVIQERLGHALTGSFTLDVYGHAMDVKENAEAARKAGAAIEAEVATVEKPDPFVSLTAVNENGLQLSKLEAVEV